MSKMKREESRQKTSERLKKHRLYLRCARSQEAVVDTTFSTEKNTMDTRKCQAKKDLKSKEVI